MGSFPLEVNMTMVKDHLYYYSGCWDESDDGMISVSVNFLSYI
jgi:hypothetical protein